MKLHLPKGLRVALLGACAALGLALPQAMAAYVVDDTVGTITFAQTGTGTNQWTMSINEESGLGVSDYTLTKITDASSIGNKTAEAQLRPDTNVQSSSGWTLTFDVTGGESETTFNGITLNSFLFNGSNRYQNDGTERKFNVTVGYGDSKSVSTGEIIITSNGSYNPASGEVTLAFDDNLVVSQRDTVTLSISFDKTNQTDGCFVGLTSVALVQGTMDPIFNWNGTAEHQTWSDADAWTERKVFTNKADAAFGTSAAVKTVSISSAVTAGSVTISDDYTFNIASSATLSASSLSLANGKTLSLAGSGSVSVANLVVDGTNTYDLGTGTTLNVTSADALEIGSSKTLQTSGAGKMTIATLRSTGGDIMIGSDLDVTGGSNGQGDGPNKNGLAITAGGGQINIQGGTTTVSGATYFGGSASGAIYVGKENTDAKLVTNRLEMGDVSGGTSTLDIGSHGAVVVKSANDTNNGTGTYKTTGLIFSEWGNTTTANVAGKLMAKDVHLYSGDTKFNLIINGGLVAVKGIAQNIRSKDTINNISLSEGGKLVLGEGGIASDNTGAWTIALNDGEVGMSADTTLGKDMVLGGTVNFNTSKYEWNSDKELVLENAGTNSGTMTISGNLTGAGKLVKTGDGTLVLSGTANVINQTIELQKGTLSLNGAFDVGGMTLQDGSASYTGADNETNGYVAFSGTVKLVNCAEGTTLTKEESATFSYNGSAGTLNMDTAIISFAGETDYTKFYVNTDTEKVSKAQEGIETLTSIVVASGATLNVDAALADTCSIESKGGTLSLAENQTLSASKLTATAMTTVTGSGTYAVNASGEINNLEALLGNNVKLTGDSAILRITGGQFKGVNLNASEKLGVRAVEVNGITGGYLFTWDKGETTALAQNIILTDNGDAPAWKWTDGSSTAKKTQAFSGTWSGTGTFLKETTDKQECFVFSGNVKDWTGKIRVNSGAVTDLTFKGNAKEINLKSITNESTGAMKVSFEETEKTTVAAAIDKKGTGALNVTVGADVDFTNTINATSLTVNAGKTAEFGANVTLSSLTLTAGATIDFGTTVGITAETLNIGGAITLGENLSTALGNLTEGSLTLFSGVKTFNYNDSAYSSETSISDIFFGVDASKYQLSFTDSTVSITLAPSPSNDFIIGTTTEAGTYNDLIGEAGKSSTVTGKVEITGNIEMAPGSTLALQGASASVTNGGVTISGTEGGQATIKGGEDNNYTVSEATVAVAENAEGETVTFSHSVAEAAVVNNTTQKSVDMVLSGASNSVTSIEAITGDITIMNVGADAPVTLSKLTIEEGQTVAAYVGAATGEANEATLVIGEGQEGTFAAGSTLLANLVVESGATVNSAGALTMGSTVTLKAGETLNITATGVDLDVAAYVIYTDVESLILEGISTEPVAEGWYDADKVYSLVKLGSTELGAAALADYTIGYWNKSVSIVNKSVPEPTTSVLSLLALAGLAGRRRRR